MTSVNAEPLLNVSSKVFNKRTYERISRLWSRILYIDLPTFLNSRCAIFIHKPAYICTPKDLHDNFRCAKPRRKMNLFLTDHKYSKPSKLFFVKAVKLRNSLTPYITAIVSVYRFRAAIMVFHYSEPY